MKSVNGYEIIQVFESFSPKQYAMEGDPIGLHVGKLNQPVKKVMIALDVLESVVDEAIQKNVQLIIAHHPPIFRPLKKIATDTAAGRIIEKLIKHDITVYAAHTNLDIANGGVNDLLASALKLENTEVLVPTMEQKLKKLAVFVPLEHENNVRMALGNVGAGAIGNYSHCSFTTEGAGRFLPGNDTNPFIGKVGELETVTEVKIETVFPDYLEKKVLSAMLKAHPYEEVAYDIFSLDNKGEQLGLGRIGTLPNELTLEQFAEYVKDALDVSTVRVVGDLQAPIRKVAILGGDGNKYFQHAKFKGADVYVTGDVYYHTAHDMMNAGLNVVDPGHNVEKVMKNGVAELLRKLCEQKGFDVTFLASEVHTDPFIFV